MGGLRRRRMDYHGEEGRLAGCRERRYGTLLERLPDSWRDGLIAPDSIAIN